MLQLKIIRYGKSYHFKADESKPDGFSNNWKNNSLDDFILTNNGAEVFKCKCQSVANYCFGEQRPGDTIAHGDTVRAGSFTLRCFAPSRNFHGEIHAITKTRDIDGQEIDRNAMQTTKDGFQNGRWLIHDLYSKKLGRDTNYAWSAGCFILSSKDLEAFNETLKLHGIKAGYAVDGVLEENGR